MADDFDAQYGQTADVFGDAAPLLIQHLDLLPPNARVLDIGVGQGRNALPLVALGHRVLGLDPSRVAIDALATTTDAPELTLRRGSVFALETRPASFDAILCFGLVQLLDRPAIAELVARMSRWLTPGGHLFLTAWHVDDPRHEAVRASAAETLAQGSYRRADGQIRTYLARGEVPAWFPGWRVAHHWEGLGPWHRHGDAPRERHGNVHVILESPITSP